MKGGIFTSCLFCPALSSFTRSTLPPCIDIGSAWESAIEWLSLYTVGVRKTSAPSDKSNYGILLSSIGLLRFSFFFFLLFDMPLKGKCYLLVFQRKGNDRPIDTIWKEEQEKSEALHRSLPEY
jgi:hypothetical protein